MHRIFHPAECIEIVITSYSIHYTKLYENPDDDPRDPGGETQTVQLLRRWLSDSSSTRSRQNEITVLKKFSYSDVSS